mgnify:CR=1 FL=1
MFVGEMMNDRGVRVSGVVLCAKLELSLCYVQSIWQCVIQMEKDKKK